MLETLRIGEAIRSLDLPRNLLSGTLVCFIAVPLCIGIALASDAPPMAGLVAGIIGGIVVGGLSRSAVGVSGPAAGLTLLVATGVEQLSDWRLVAVAVVLSGCWQLFLGVLRLGFISTYFPVAVVEGLLAGIGLMLMNNQLREVVKWTAPTEVHLWQAAYFSLLVASLAVWPSISKRLPRGFNIIPAPVVVILVSFVLAQDFLGSLTGVPSSFDRISLPLIHESFAFSPFTSGFSLALLAENITTVLFTSLTIALVGSVETLLSLEATDRLDPMRRKTPPSRELIAQGFGNIFSGLVGGLPITQVIVRSSANIQFGGTNKTATISHGVFMLLIIVFLGNYISQIPKMGLSALLFFIGYQLVSVRKVKTMLEKGLNQFLPFATTLLGVVFAGILSGIALGLAMAVILILKRQYERTYQTKFSPSNQTLEIFLPQEMSFFHRGRLLKLFETLAPQTTLVLNGSDTLYMDTDVAEVIREFLESSEKKQISIQIIGLEEWIGKLEKGSSEERTSPSRREHR